MSDIKKCELCGFTETRKNLEHETLWCYGKPRIVFYHLKCLENVINYSDEDNYILDKALRIYSIRRKRLEREYEYEEERRKKLKEAKEYFFNREEEEQEYPEHRSFVRMVRSMSKDLDFVCKWIRSSDEYKEWIADGNKEEDL